MQFFLLCSATATFMINELVNNYEENKAIVDNLNIHFLPMANPDGYEYSRNSDRMWRKNRNRDNKAAGGTHLKKTLVINEFTRCFHQFVSPILVWNFSQFERLKKKT